MNAKLKKFLLSIIYYFRHTKSYSQDGEDAVLLSFYEGIKNYKGFYVDVGAHHPVRFSNTYLFYKKGWKGINIDPTPNSMRPFKLIRSKDVNLEIGIGTEAAKMNFFCFNEPALNTFDEGLAKERSNEPNHYIIKTIAVPIRPLKNVLDECLPKNKQIDFFTIDVEGLDLEVLKSNNWSKYRPKYILVEDVDFKIEEPEKSKIFKFLKSHNYKIVASLKRTIIYEAIITSN